MIKLILLGIFILFFSSSLFAQVVINEVEPNSGGSAMVELKNTGGTTVDISSWTLCSVANGANYNAINSLTTISGSATAFAPGSLLVLSGLTLQAQDELALYVSSPYTSSSNMRAYLRWGNPGVGRSMVAQGANLWTVGNSVTVGALTAGYSIQYDGDGQTGERGYNPTMTPTINAPNSCSFGPPNGGTVLLINNEDTISGVANIGTFSFYTKTTSIADTLSYWYIITTEQDSILGWVNANTMRDSALMTINAPVGTCHIWGWSYKGLSNPVMGEHISTLDDNICEEISTNWITVIRQEPNGGTVLLMNNQDTISGVANTGTFSFYVKNTGTADLLSYWYIITTEQDSILGWVNANTMRDSALMTINAPVGTCHIWGWSYKGLSNPVMGEHISTLDDDAREDISTNWITVIRQEPNGGTVLLMNNQDTISGVANIGTFSFYVKNTGTADLLSYWYIITTEQDSILGWVNANTMRDSALMTINAPVGTCHIWGWSYKGLSNPVMGEHISTLDDDAREDISTNWITVIRQEPNGGTVLLMNNQDTISGVANTGTFSFYVKNTGTADLLSYWYIITTEQDSILGWVNANTMRDSALMTINAPVGTCHIWGWSYKGLSNPVMGEHISTLDDDAREDISTNWINVIRMPIVSSIGQTKDIFDFGIFPNPVTSTLNIQGNNIELIRIISSNGQILKETSEHSINVKELPSSVYLLEAVDNLGNRSIRKFIKS